MSASPAADGRKGTAETVTETVTAPAARVNWGVGDRSRDASVERGFPKRSVEGETEGKLAVRAAESVEDLDLRGQSWYLEKPTLEAGLETFVWRVVEQEPHASHRWVPLLSRRSLKLAGKTPRLIRPRRRVLRKAHNVRVTESIREPALTP